MTTPVSHIMGLDTFQDESPIYIPQEGTFQLGDGTVVFCEALWGDDLFKKSIIKNEEDDYDI
jgi:hypothetical protein